MDPNIVWVTLDSVRFDHTSLAGYERDTTPTLQRIATAERGRSLDACIAHGVWTLPSTTSILTGTHPAYHGVGVGRNEALPDDLRTVPEMVAERGYRTAVLSRNSNLSGGTNLVRGFDRRKLLLASNLHREVAPTVLLKYLRRLRSHSAGFSLDKTAHSTPYLVTEVGRRWLAELERADDPFFLYVHYNEPHKPYFPPLPYLDRYTNGLAKSGLEAGREALRIHREAPTGQEVDLSGDQWEILQAMYDAEIAYTDASVGRLFDAIREADLGPTTVVVTADHGEHLGEYGPWFGHDSLYDEVIRVPLVVYGDGVEAFDGVELCQHVDVMQTLLARAGIEDQQFQGVDLDGSSRDTAFTQTAADDDPGRLHYSLRSSTHKYVDAGEETALYEFPDEATDVSADDPDLVSTFQTVHEDWVEELGTVEREGARASFTDEMRSQLEDMGYLTD